MNEIKGAFTREKGHLKSVRNLKNLHKKEGTRLNGRKTKAGDSKGGKRKKVSHFRMTRWRGGRSDENLMKFKTQ